MAQMCICRCFKLFVYGGKEAEEIKVNIEIDVLLM